MTKDEIQKLMQDNDLTVESVFIPFSRSRNAKGDWTCLNWQVTLRKGGYVVCTTDYSAGVGHCPADKAKLANVPGNGKYERGPMIAFEIENGVEAQIPWGNGHVTHKNPRKPIKPDSVDVLYSLVLDSDVLDYPTFEEWADTYGYDKDSRKGEQVYRACLEIALKMRSGLGESLLAELKEAFCDY